MKKLATILLLVLTMGAAARAAEPGFHPRAESIVGVASLTRGTVTSPLRRNAFLQPDDRISVEKGSVVLRWPDGTRARLPAGTRIYVREATGAPAGTMTRVQLDTGAFWLNVRKFARRPARFEVQTGRTLGAVEGTRVLYRMDPRKDESTLQVFSSKVQCWKGPDMKCELVTAGTRHVHDQTMGSHYTDIQFRKDFWRGP
jgi:hypothetical protein